MVKFMKPGRVVIVLAGRHAGKKAVVVQNSEVGNKERPYGHCVVAGVDRAPLKIHKKMSKKMMAFKSRVRPFIKVVNHNHLMPTRYNMELGSDFRKMISLVDSKRAQSKKNVKKVFQDRHNGGKQKWFFQKLRF
eukprot:NODE_704_length_658_cov_518.966102_g695_i0.p1 GENE.NODE_704_length_658_cov_518.966102_g695_i0~~NODE_704_length_658_cov_518.966102_g695_i0.p1  ORF type:complete len:134 (+),score=26.39 NODE_704_length_658_cov_518.966102_g695_i0:79-480(+)